MITFRQPNKNLSRLQKTLKLLASWRHALSIPARWNCWNLRADVSYFLHSMGICFIQVSLKLPHLPVATYGTKTKTTR